jgi:electron transport complex protein RnfB
MAQDVYERLSAFLDQQPARFPPTESAVELKILRKLFTPREAEMATALRMFLSEPVSKDRAPAV